MRKNEFADQNLGLDEDRRRDRGDGRDRFGDRGSRFDRDDRRGGRFGDRDDRGRSDGDAAFRPGRLGDRRGDDRGNSRFGRGDGPDRDRGGYGDRPRVGDRDRNDRSSGPREGAGRNGYFDKDDRRAPREREANMTRLMVSIGRRDYVRPGDIVGAIAGEANIPGNTIGSIDIFDKFSYVDVPKDVANRVVDVMEGNTIKGKRVQIEVAR